VIEWRVDFFDKIAGPRRCWVRPLARRGGRDAIIFTCRAAHEGGTDPLDAEGVTRLYDRSAARLVDFIDFELSNPAALVRRVRERTREQNTRFVICDRTANFGYTPGHDCWSRRLPHERTGWANVARSPQCARSCRLRADTLARTPTGGVEAASRIISMSMWPAWRATRIRRGVFGSRCVRSARGLGPAAADRTSRRCSARRRARGDA